MVIKGRKFYDMLDAGTQVKFGVQDVVLVTLEHVVLDYVDDEFEYVGSTHLFMVAVLLVDGRYVATEPHHDQDFVATIGHTLSDMCNKYRAARLN